MQRYEVFVQWERGSAHEHTQSVRASDSEMAITLAKRNVDVRREPTSIWVTPNDAIEATETADPTLSPATEREYRNISWYAQSEP